MAHIVIEKSGFSGAERLAIFLDNRMAKVSWYEDNHLIEKKNNKTAADSSDPKVSSVDAFVCSSDFADKVGGVPGITDIARMMKYGSPRHFQS